MKTIRHKIFILSIIVLTVTGLTFNAGQASDEFPIATTTGREEALSAAFDGTNYLVGIQGDATAHYNITAQLVSQSGALVGSRISTGRTGGDPLIAFDGTNYLLVWPDDATYPNDVIYGQFVSKSGTIVGSPFPIGQTIIKDIWGLAFGGGNYLVVYQGNSYALYGRTISTSGTVGNEIAIGTAGGPSSGLNSVAFDGTNFLMVWDTNTTIKGRFIGTNGNLSGSEFTVRSKQKTQCDSPVNVAFDGTNYLVVWHDNIDPCGGGYFNGTADLFGQIVTPSGSLSGGVINISVAPGDQILPSIAIDGTNYLVTWTEGFGSTEAMVKGRFFDKSGGPVGSEFTLFSPSGGRVPWLASTIFDGSKYFSVINRGTPGTDPTDVDAYTNQDVYGAFISYSPAHGEWTTKTSMPAARDSAAVGVINGVLYVAGGYNGTQTSTLWAYNPTTDTWGTLAPMPDGRYQGDGAGVINGQLYVAGGWDNTYSWLPHRELFVYDPATNSWSSKANMPILSACGASGVINGKLYVTTACDGYSGARNFLHVYDPATDTWSSLAPSPNAHGYPASGVINNKFYVAGGVDDSGVFQAKLDIYNPATNTWTTKASMPVAGGGFASEVINGKLYVVGGSNGASVYYNTVYVYDPSTDTWTTETSMPTARAFAGAGVINGVLYVVGGTNSTGTLLATVEAFVPVTTPCTEPSIASHPQSQTIQSGQTATLSVTATGTAPLSYQWYQGSSGDTSNPISGATSSSYTTPALTQTTNYWVKVMNSCGSANSNTATITVGEAISTPNSPSGPTNGTTGTSYSYSTGGSTSNLGHSMQYQFDWGDGTYSDWLSVGTTSVSKSWTSAGSYTLKAQARCATHTSVVSGWSSALFVNIFITNWTAINTGLTNPDVWALAIHPQTPDTIYAGTYGGGVFKSTNGGTNWTAINTGLTNTSVFALAIDPQTPDTIYAGTYYGDVFKSTNGGTNWTVMNTGLTNSLVRALTINPQTPSTLYAGTYGGGVFKSTNGGMNWTDMNTGLTTLYVYALAIDPQTPETLYAGTYSRGVFKSTKGGTDWTAMNTGLTNTTVYALAINPQTPETLYAGTWEGGVFKSTNGGMNWTSMNTGLTNTSVFVLAIDPQTPETLYAGTYGGGVFKSTNGGMNWTDMNTGLTNTDVRTLAIDPQTPSTLYAGTWEGGVFKIQQIIETNNVFSLADFDGDGATDVGGFHLPTDQFFTEYADNLGQFGWGGSDSMPLIWDYDGDGKTDVSIYHIPTNQWFVKGVGNLGQFGWGGEDSIPVPGDYNGDGRMERAFYHSPTNQWFVEGQDPIQFGWGGAECIPVPGDYDGDGKTDMVIYHVPSNQWFQYGVGNLGQFGWEGEDCIPVPGDYNGDGITDIAVYHVPTNQWFVKGIGNLGQYGWGGLESFPIPGDYNGDGVMERGFYRPSENWWFIEGESDFVWGWGGSEFMPITSQIAVYNWFRFMLGRFQ
jgi:N-acetylneuraminic acid mutarotase